MYYERLDGSHVDYVCIYLYLDRTSRKVTMKRDEGSHLIVSELLLGWLIGCEMFDSVLK